MRKVTTTLLLLLTLSAVATAATANWRKATAPELRKLLPKRAAVVKENIETEFRTASGVTDGKGKFVAGVVMITAGYSAEGKYSHFFVTQVTLQLGDLTLQPGEYVFGYQRSGNDTIKVSFYRASSGDSIGDLEAYVNRKKNLVTSLLISPAVNGKGTIQLGRFVFEYKIAE
ncbi:MAG TPA: hypothetical protein VI306_17680 [Pyrinomonadaceae bacterium]